MAQPTRERVREAIDRLNYEIDAVAQVLSGKRSQCIGIVFPGNMTSMIHPPVIRAVEETASGLGYCILQCHSFHNPVLEEKHLRMLHTRRVDGILLGPWLPSGTGEVEHSYLDYLVQQSFPLVLFDRVIRDLPIDTVSADNEGGAFQAVDHLIRLGHRRIGMVAGTSGHSTSEARLAGYRRALREHGLAEDPSLIVYGNYQVPGSFQATVHLLDLPEPPCAILSCNGTTTVGVIAALRSRGLSIPDDIALIGFDDHFWTFLLDPPLTTVAIPARELGTKTTEMLVERIEGAAPFEPRHVVLPLRLVIGGSCGAKAPADRLDLLADITDRLY